MHAEFAGDVLRRIRRRCIAIEQAYHQGSAGQREIHAIDVSISNAQRIQGIVSPEAICSIANSLADLKSLIIASLSSNTGFHAAHLHSGGPGRPALDIKKEQIQLLIAQGFTVRSMARMLGCSSSYLHKKIRHYQIAPRMRFNSICDADLDEHVRRLHEQFPRAGSNSEIQRRLNMFTSAWNNHHIRTANNRTPTQLWMEGMLANRDQETAAVEGIFGDDPYSEQSLEAGLARHGIQLLQLQARDDDLQRAVTVRQPTISLSPAQMQALDNTLIGTTDLKQRYLLCVRETLIIEQSNLVTLDN
ncbi:uncharacterized protein V6R79_016965 [Siganus canaliculatus]